MQYLKFFGFFFAEILGFWIFLEFSEISAKKPEKLENLKNLKTPKYDSTAVLCC